MQERLFHLSLDKQILKKHLSCAVKYLVGQVGHGISTGLDLNFTLQHFHAHYSVFSSPVQSTGRAIVLTLASALALTLPFPSRHF